MNGYILIDFIPLAFFIVVLWMWHKLNKKVRVKQRKLGDSTKTTTTLEQDSYEDSISDSEGDGLMSEGDIFFPPEEPEPEDED